MTDGTILHDLVAEIMRRTDKETALGLPTPQQQADLDRAGECLASIRVSVQEYVRRRAELRRELESLDAILGQYDEARRRLRIAQQAARGDQGRRDARLYRYRAGTDKLIDRLDRLDPEWRARVLSGGPMLRPDQTEESDDD